ncbi:MAG: hypothetical protein HOP12_04190 [Candidatus Eisenbacteria bacterium]|uniref:FlgD Ig-like domain-containing protein n=1 Tax=Eiseniibacteriota bacterium TaxID=2212470 RepID=A0A849SID8_UNCEI|nr:hypothetical protein [Candidatus Eisenbacteria bacterium]
MPRFLPPATVLAAAMLLVAAVTPAAADLHYYVKPFPLGNDANSGTSFVSAWATLEHAFDQVSPPNAANGDIYIHVLGNVSTGSGWQSPAFTPADGRRLIVVGTNLADPSTTVIDGGSLVTSHVTFIGLTFASRLQVDSTAFSDSIRDCRLIHSLSIDGDYFTILRSTILGSKFDDDLAIGAAGQGIRTVGTRIVACTIDLGSGLTERRGIIHTGKAGIASNTHSFCDSTLFERNDITLRITSIAGEMPAVTHYWTLNMVKQYNRWQIINDNSSEYSLVYKVRDGSENHVWNADTLRFTGPRASSVWLTQGGNIAEGSPNVRNWTIDSCYVHFERGALEWHSGIRFASMTYTTVVSQSGVAMKAEGDSVVGENRFDHNTFVGVHGDSSNGAGGIVVFHPLDQWESASRIRFTNNIVAAADPVRSNWPCPHPPTSDGSVTIDGARAALVYPEEPFTCEHFDSDHNLFSNYTYGDVPGDRSLLWQGASKHCSGVGAGSELHSACSNVAGDSSSVYGSAQFAFGGTLGDSLPSANFNPAPGPQSAARGAGSAGSGIGALAFSPGSGLWISSGSSFDFSTSGCPALHTGTIEITNSSNSVASILGVVANSTTLGDFAPASLSIPAGGSRTLDFTYQVVGAECSTPVVRTITLTTNSASAPSLMVPVTLRENSVVAVNPGRPPVLALAQVHPNPLATPARFEFSVTRSTIARLDLFDLGGRRVCTLFDGVANAGTHHVDWSGADLRGRRVPPGLYWLRLEADSRRLVRKVAIVR